MDKNKEIGNKIEAARKEKGLSLQDVANKVSVARSTIQRYEQGTIKTIKLPVVAAIANALGVNPAWLIGKSPHKYTPTIPPEAIPYVRGRRLPILGDIPAGTPILAVENIEGYDYADVPEGEDYFFLRVRGDSMINAGISTGDLVLIKVQPCADNGQIVACRINGDEATLKRFKQQGDTVLLLPENPGYEPIMVSRKEFEQGYASVIGVAVEVKRKL